jgi:hypothetical protein
MVRSLSPEEREAMRRERESLLQNLPERHRDGWRKRLDDGSN